MTMSPHNRKIHTAPGEEPTLQSSLVKRRDWGLLGKCLGVNSDPEPGAELNRRPQSPLNALQVIGVC
jgi:hypothetical protein